MPNIVTCPDREILQRLMLGQIAGPQGEELAQHLEECDLCTAIVATLRGEDTLVAAAQSTAAEEPQREAVGHLIERLRRFGPPSPGSPSPEDADATADELDNEHLSPSPPVASIRDYELLEPIGHGGMGTVYKARHTKLKRIVALKLLPEGRTPNAVAVRRFEREMEAVGKLKHPNIVHAYDAGEEGGRRYLVMEYVEGIDLSRLCKRHGPLPIADACEIVRQAALGLQHAHEHGMVHRDIKPSNLMLTLLPSPANGRGAGGTSLPSPAYGRGAGGEGAQPEVKVLDLGLALLRDDPATEDDPAGTTPAAPRDAPTSDGPHSSGTKEDLTGTQVMGTCDYMAPEQAIHAHVVDIRADIYSLGCTLYKLLAGRAPFDSPEYDTPLRKLTAQAQIPAPPIQQHRAEVPEELAALVHRMLAKDPAKRFATPAEVAEALAPFATDSELAALLEGVAAGSEAKPRASAARTIPPRRRRWRLALAAGGAAAAVLLGVVVLISTGKGSVRLEFSDAEAARQCSVSIDGDEIRLENLGEPIKLRPGKHELRVKHGGLEIETREFTLVRRGHEVLRVSIPAAKGELRLAKDAGARESARFYADRACEYGQSLQWEEARIAYIEAIRLEPTVAEYYIGRGELYWGMGGAADPPLADFSEAIRLDPTSADSRVSRGTVYYQIGEIDKAISDFEAALRLSPDCVPRHFRRAEAYGLAYGRWRARYEYFKAVAIYGALVESDKRKLDQALGDFRKLVDLKDEIVPAWLHWVSWWLPSVVQGKDKLPGIVFVSDLPWVRSTCGWGPPSAVRNTSFGGPVLLGPLPYSKGMFTHAFDDPRPADVVVDVSGQTFATFKAHVGAADVGGSVQYQVLADGKVRCETPVLRFGNIQSISVDVAGAKEIILRVLNGGDNGTCDGAPWGFARFVQAGAEDPLEEPPAQLQSATDANAALFLAEVHGRLNQKDLARRWYDKAVAWMDKNKPEAEKLRPFRADAAKLLGKG